MVLLETADAVRRWVERQRHAGHRIGFVPTMGYLHEGHLSLVRVARQSCDRVILSIFVNPTQFGPNEDFARYPRDLERDKQLARPHVDALFAPASPEIYPPDSTTTVDVGEMGTVMCGASRPGHFRGVATVVTKLLNIVTPEVAVFGQKDAQQFFILRRVIRDLNIHTAMVMAPIVREPDGLAMSSRNVYLSVDERKQALALSESLRIAQDLVTSGERQASTILHAMTHHVQRQSLARIDYITIRETESLTPIETVANPALIALAVFVGSTRLIDNWIFE